MDKIRIELGQVAGNSHVFVGETEIKPVRSVCVKQSVGELATIVLELVPDKIEITGMADTMRKYASVTP